MRYVVSTALLAAGVIHLLPVTGVLGSTRLSALYGLDFQDPSLALLMRHRAVLFGLIGLLLITAAFRAHLRGLAFAAGFVSVASFLALAELGGPITAELRRVVVADWIALSLLVAGIGAHALERRHSGSALAPTATP